MELLTHLEPWALYPALALLCFLSATLVPLPSEGVLAALVLTQAHSPWGLLLVASFANVLGSLSSWALGHYLSQRSVSPRMAVSLHRARQYYGRWGCGSLLLSWLPVVGDGLCLLAGLMREPLWRTAGLLVLAKTGRYLLVVLVSL